MFFYINQDHLLGHPVIYVYGILLAVFAEPLFPPQLFGDAAKARQLIWSEHAQGLNSP